MFRISGQLQYLEGNALEERWERAPRLPIHDDVPPMADSDRLYRVNQHGHRRFNFSLLPQLEIIMGELDSADISSGRVGYFMTANSAIPLAHTVRGLHDQLGLPELYIDTIDVFARHRRARNPLSQYVSIRSEIKRIGYQVKQNSLEAAVIVDQFTSSGDTLRLGVEMLGAAGVDRGHIYPVAGLLYPQLHRTEDEPARDLLTAKPEEEPFAAYFYMLGCLAAHQLRTPVEAD